MQDQSVNPFCALLSGTDAVSATWINEKPASAGLMQILFPNKISYFDWSDISLWKALLWIGASLW